MALRPVDASEDEIPQELRSLYALEEGGTRFLLQVDPAEGFSLENVSALTAALGRLKEQARVQQQQLKAFAGLERDPETLAAELDELTRLRGSAGKSERELREEHAHELEQVRQVARSESEKRLAPLQSALTARTQQLQRALVDAALETAILAEGGAPKLLAGLRSSIRTVEAEDGSLRTEVVDASGNPRVVGPDLRPMEIRALVQEAKADPEYGRAFQATTLSGGGTPAGTGRGANASLTAEQAGALSMDEYRAARQAGRVA
jgi:hypothetical protein